MDRKTAIYRYTRLILLVLFFGAIPLQTSCTAEQEEVRQPATTVDAKTQEQKQPQRKVFQTISPVEARALLEQNDKILLVDVRTPAEINQMKIEGSVAIPVGDVIRGKFKVAPTQPVLLVCAVGGRSYIAGKALASRGHQEVYNLGGGVEAWYRAGLPVQ